MNMYVGNLSYETTEADLMTVFSSFGHVESVKIIMDEYARRSKGFAFVDMPDNSEADTAIKTLNKTGLNGNLIKVNAADNGGNRRLQRKKNKRKRF